MDYAQDIYIPNVKYMPQDAKDKGYTRQFFSLCLFQLHFASHIGQNTNDTKKEEEKMY